MCVTGFGRAWTTEARLKLAVPTSTTALVACTSDVGSVLVSTNLCSIDFSGRVDSLCARVRVPYGYA